MAARFVPPLLLQLVPKLTEGEQWQYEVKWDGYRGIAVIQNGEARLWSRNERDLGKRFSVLPAVIFALLKPTPMLATHPSRTWS